MRQGAALLCLILAACAKPPLPAPPQAPQPTTRFTVSQENLSRDLAFLTDEAQEGRNVRTQGIRVAAGYIAAQMKEMGLSPGVSDGTYLSEISAPQYLDEVMLNEETGWYTPRRYFVPLKSSPSGELQAEVVFVDEGTPKDFEGLEVSGKIVLLLFTQEQLQAKNGDFSQLDGYKRAAEAGASAILLSDLLDNRAPSIKRVKEARGPLALYVDTRVSKTWLGRPEGGDPDFTPRSLKRLFALKVSSSLQEPLQNVVGILEPTQKDAKTILIGAHYDGVTYPAADDNASGTAALLEIARALASA